MAKVFLNEIEDGLDVKNIFCIGRNYAAHAIELGNKIEDSPIIFLKPTSSINTNSKIVLPDISSDIHYETELIILIGKDGKNIPESDYESYIEGYGIGLDLTARDIQSQAKKNGHPWTLSKGFDGAACVSRFLRAPQLQNHNSCSFTMKINGNLKQIGNTENMLFKIPFLIAYLSKHFSLSRGDLIYTGTPEGVGRLTSGDHLELELDKKLLANFHVA